ncbi:cell growth-regulating nucleolar protein [Polypterus senegalus]|uniref:cell growth-regulating nucleolar protein n=1 Tax=Polypterus senegalus TaxID=55291 RepID=UPI001966315D|nr:cell growth-regulating nucleolar protein [Polypterus senegalus]XP_039607416.1 cell growth-regulating nucleolar protein [Polypterus senegalus]XP_039607417.1 cell growth-regulating nucleolar protein [Polypterus senegalus]XP_039607418.1 cell growth-regulating nucleolar protein [Polypterus senegalus]
MVFFTCNACGESLKKAQVEKHLNICRKCECLSCIDCGKDFWGNDYLNHLKCMSENEKYGGKGYEAKSSKGDVKQQQWIQKIHEAMNKPGVNPKVAEILKQISSYDNVPRKKAKFQNWMKNSLRIHNTALHDQVWEIFSACSVPNSKEDNPSLPQESLNQNETLIKDNVAASDEKKKSKRERKEERKNKSKKEKKHLKLDNKKGNEDRKSTKKDKIEDSDSQSEGEDISKRENGELKKKKKQHATEDFEEIDVVNENEHESSFSNGKRRKRKLECSEENTKVKQLKTEPEDVEFENENKGKFNWKGTIKAVLRSAPEDGIPLKKLKKKVLAQYYAVTGEHNHKTEEELNSLFNKKIKSNPKFRLLKEKVILVK